MKKLTRKLFVSIMTLVLTAMALGTSTFAWFSSNSAVKATDMEVTVKANSQFLLIGGTNVLADIQSGGLVSVAPTAPASTTVYPVSYNNSASPATVAYMNGENATSASIPAYGWYTALSNEIETSTGDTIRTNVEEVTAGDADYMCVYNVYLTLAGPATGDIQTLTKTLTVAATFSAISSSNTEAVKCVVNVGSAVATGVSTNDAALGRLHFDASNTSTTIANVTVDSAHIIPVTIYLYVDGEEAITKTESIMDGIKLAGSLVLNFSLS